MGAGAGRHAFEALRRGARVHVATSLERFRGDRETVRRKTVSAALAGLLVR